MSLVTPRHRTAYIRYPDVRGDLVTFVAADDVWLAPFAGGRAWRLTDDGAPVSYPRISPDGEHVAFTSRVSGRPELYTVRTDGAEAPVRLTYWGNANTRTAGWLPDGRVLVSSGAQDGMPRQDAFLFAIELDGTSVRLPLGRASEVAVHPDGTTVTVSPWRNEPSHWKHYRGGTAARFWISHEPVALDAPAERHAARSWERFLPEILSPVYRASWYGDRLVFASDYAGPGTGATDRATSNLWSVSEDGSNLHRHTDLTSDTGYVRDPATDGRGIVFTSHGRLHRMTSLDAEPEEIPLELAGIDSARRPFDADTATNLIALRPDSDARGSVVEWRGSAHYLTHRSGPARLLAGRSGVRIREAAPLGATGYAVFASDERAGETGHDELHVRPLDASTPEAVLASSEFERILHLAASPDGTKVATISQEGTIRLITLHRADGQAPTLDAVRTIGHSEDGEASGLAFSPDSRFLAWQEPSAEVLSRLLLSDTTAADPTGTPLTSGRFRDADPVFSLDGKYLAFLSGRTFETVYDDIVFDLDFINSMRPYLLPLAKDTVSPFGPDLDGWGFVADPAAGAGGTSTPEDKPSPPATTVDLDRIEQRVIPFPVASGYFSDLRATKDGFVWLRHGIDGELGATTADVPGATPAGPALERWDLTARKSDVLAEGVTAVEPSGDGTRLVVAQGENRLVIPADHKVEDTDPDRVEIDLDRLHLRVDPVAERRGMLWDNHRIMKQQYWRADMDGQDWDAMVGWYDPQVDLVVTRDDFADLLYENVAELGTSHSYVTARPTAPAAAQEPGFLGAQVARHGDRWIIGTILEGDTSAPGARSPLLAAAVAARPGDAIVAVSGQEVDPATGPAPLLVGRGGQPTELVLEREGTRRRVVVVPLEDEGALRYQNWVAARRAYVAEHSGGRLGYLHIPDMVSEGWAQMHRDLRDASHREGLIVDVRYNRGGHTSQLVTDRLARKVVSWGYARGSKPQEYPAFAPRGPVVLVTNEEAGSDGDIVNAVSQAMGIGPVIGRRTWGGVIGIDGRFDLVDGTDVTEPKYASWFEGKDWSIENYGVDPDIDVDYPPSAYAAGIDPQLDRAIEETFALLEQHPAATAPDLPPARF